jgi:hypothetical protein
MNKITSLATIAFVMLGCTAVIVIALITLGIHAGVSPGDTQIACTMEARLCPDGSYVGRTGSRCEFSACPAILTPTSTVPGADWKTGMEVTQKYSFAYPVKPGTAYVSAAEWPPVLTMAAGMNFRCTGAGSEINVSGKTERATINGREYCVTRKSEGAAGSVYREYAYTFSNEKDLLTLSFAFRFPQCANYNQSDAAECVADQAALDIDALADQIAHTIHPVSFLR